MDKLETIALLDRAKGYFKNFNITDEVIGLWARRLESYTEQEARYALDNYYEGSAKLTLQLGEYMNYVRIAARSLRDQLPDAQIKQRDEQWAKRGVWVIPQGTGFNTERRAYDERFYARSGPIPKHPVTARDQLEFAMDVLTPAVVTQELEVLLGCPAEKVEWSALMAQKGWIPKYKAKVKELYDMAVNLRNNPIRKGL